MNTRHVAYALLAVFTVSATSDLFAQRRRTDGSGSSGRGTPSGGGSRSGGESRRGGSSGGTQARPTRPSGSAGGEQRPSGGGSVQRGGSGGGEGQSSGSDAQAQSGARPESGKIGAARARARDVQGRTRRGGGVIYGGGVYIGGCWDCYYWGGYHGRWGWYDGGWWYPARHPHRRHYPDEYDDDRDEGYAGERMGQGYQEYPYAEADGTGETFVQRRGGGRRGFGAVSGFFFSDLGSTTQAGHVALEGAIRMFHADVEYGNYREPVAGGTDRLQTLRFAVGAQPALGTWGYLIAGVGARGVFLDDGSKAGGPEGTLGLQVFPARPLGINVTGRLAALSWTGRDHFAMSELNTTGSVFLGRVELQAGWHWMKMEGSPGFGGPIVGTRIWF